MMRDVWMGEWVGLSEQLPRLTQAWQQVWQHPFLFGSPIHHRHQNRDGQVHREPDNVGQDLGDDDEMVDAVRDIVGEQLVDCLGVGVYGRQRALLKDFGQRALYPMLQHCEQAKHIRQRRKLHDKAAERYDSALQRHSLGKDDLVSSSSLQCSYG
jgi:hypothetical protein